MQYITCSAWLTDSMMTSIITRMIKHHVHYITHTLHCKLISWWLVLNGWSNIMCMKLHCIMERHDHSRSNSLWFLLIVRTHVESTDLHNLNDPKNNAHNIKKLMVNYIYITYREVSLSVLKTCPKFICEIYRMYVNAIFTWRIIGRVYTIHILNIWFM